MADRTRPPERDGAGAGQRAEQLASVLEAKKSSPIFAPSLRTERARGGQEDSPGTNLEVGALRAETLRLASDGKLSVHPKLCLQCRAKLRGRKRFCESLTQNKGRAERVESALTHHKREASDLLEGVAVGSSPEDVEPGRLCHHCV